MILGRLAPGHCFYEESRQHGERPEHNRKEYLAFSSLIHKEGWKETVLCHHQKKTTGNCAGSLGNKLVQIQQAKGLPQLESTTRKRGLTPKVIVTNMSNRVICTGDLDFSSVEAPYFPTQHRLPVVCMQRAAG